MTSPRRFKPYAAYKSSGVEWLGEIPAHWRLTKMWDVAQATSGGTPAKETLRYWDGGIPWVSPEDMKRRFIDSSEDTVSEAAVAETGLKVIVNPAVLVVVRGMILAHSFPVGITTVPVTINQDMKALRLSHAVDPQFFGYWLEGVGLGPEHGVTLGQMMARLDGDTALDASARVNTRENVRLAFDHKVEDVIQEIVESNFDLYKRITDDRGFGEAVKNFLFDQYLRGHRQADELLKQRESKTLEFKSTLRWNLREGKKDPQVVTHAVLKTIAAFLNTEGGDLLIGVADDRSIVGIEVDDFESDDRFLLHLSHVAQAGLGDRAGTCVDPKIQVVQGKSVCLVSCQRSPEPVFLKWKGVAENPDGEFYVRSGPGTVRLSVESAQQYIRTRFPGSG